MVDFSIETFSYFWIEENGDQVGMGVKEANFVFRRIGFEIV